MSSAFERIKYASRKLSWSGKEKTDVIVGVGVTLTLYGASLYYTHTATHFHKDLFYKEGKKIVAPKTATTSSSSTKHRTPAKGNRYELNKDEVVIEWRDYRPGSETRWQMKKLTNKPIRVKNPAACVASLLADYTLGEDDLEELFDLLGVKDDMTVDYDKPSEEYITTILNGYIRAKSGDIAGVLKEEAEGNSLLKDFGHEEGNVVGLAKKYKRNAQGKLELVMEEGKTVEFYLEVADALDRKFERMKEVAPGSPEYGEWKERREE